MLMTFFVCMFW